MCQGVPTRLRPHPLGVALRGRASSRTLVLNSVWRKRRQQIGDKVTLGWAGTGAGDQEVGGWWAPKARASVHRLLHRRRALGSSGTGAARTGRMSGGSQLASLPHPGPEPCARKQSSKTVEPEVLYRLSDLGVCAATFGSVQHLGACRCSFCHCGRVRHRWQQTLDEMPFPHPPTQRPGDEVSASELVRPPALEAVCPPHGPAFRAWALLPHPCGLCQRPRQGLPQHLTDRHRSGVMQSQTKGSPPVGKV